MRLYARRVTIAALVAYGILAPVPQQAPHSTEDGLCYAEPSQVVEGVETIFYPPSVPHRPYNGIAVRCLQEGND